MSMGDELPKSAQEMPKSTQPIESKDLPDWPMPTRRMVKSITDIHSQIEPIPTHLVESIVAVNSKIDLIKMLSRKKVEAQIKCEQLGSMPTPIDGEARIQAVIAFDLARYEYIEANRALEAALQQP